MIHWVNVTAKIYVYRTRLDNYDVTECEMRNSIPEWKREREKKKLWRIYYMDVVILLLKNLQVVTFSARFSPECSAKLH